jgi:ribosome-associated protein YbcJ (S4-like RNA binding protein)
MILHEFLTQQHLTVSRSETRRLLLSGAVSVNGQVSSREDSPIVSGDKIKVGKQELIANENPCSI